MSASSRRLDLFAYMGFLRASEFNKRACAFCFRVKRKPMSMNDSYGLQIERKWKLEFLKMKSI